MIEPSPVYAWTATGLHCLSWAITLSIAIPLNTKSRKSRTTASNLTSRIEAGLWAYLATIDIAHVAINAIHATEMLCAGQPTSYGVLPLDPALPCLGIWLDVLTDCLEAVAAPVYPLLLMRLATGILPVMSTQAYLGQRVLHGQALVLTVAAILFVVFHFGGSLPAFGFRGPDVNATAKVLSDIDRDVFQVAFCGIVVLAQFFSIAFATRIMNLPQLRRDPTPSRSPTQGSTTLRRQIMSLRAARSPHPMVLSPPNHNDTHSGSHSHSTTSHNLPVQRFSTLMRSMHVLLFALVLVLSTTFLVMIVWPDMPIVLYSAMAWLGVRFSCLVYYMAIKNVTVLVLLRRQIPNPDAGTLAASAWVQSAPNVAPEPAPGKHSNEAAATHTIGQPSIMSHEEMQQDL